ncbi:MAG: DUF5343 domain-containing protein, partial [Dehalococcoidia bacterium]|nr:DUF5343 domain-containing protein [Dehalococcoidia bacterium]
MANQTFDTLPYTATAWLTRLIEELRRRLPSQLDAAWLTQRLNLSVPNARQLVGVLQRMGWVDKDGNLTDRARGLRQTGEPYQRHLQEMVRDLYPVLLDTVEQDDTFDSQRLREYITNATELGESARQQMARTFRWF